MRYKGWVGQLASERRRLGLTQSQLAERSGVSRVTIARLEAGSAGDVRAATLDHLCGALGLELAARRVDGPGAEQRLEREREQGRRLARRLAHAVLAARLVMAPGRASRAALARARSEVDRWQRDGLCSSHYISRWRRLLAGTPQRVARSLLDPGEWADALFQNTPFAFELERTV